MWKIQSVENEGYGKCGVWKMRRKFLFSISITIFHPKNTQTERSYMICIPHQARLVLPLIIYSWIHCTQLRIIHQAFLSTEQVFLIHTRHHFKFTRKAFPPELQPPYRPFSSFQPSAAAGTLHSGLSPHSYYLVALPTYVKKCYGCGEKEKSSQK